ncbi:MAG: class I SAM-dependent RNA methyltransferase [Proteobacteria bacterium]|nr:class I SAM-dependent RNA methyltransferase [Pseudomonadota bacterium]
MRSYRKKRSKEPCPIQEQCRICPYVNLDYDSSLSEKSSKELGLLKRDGLLSEAKVHRTISSPRKLGYRTVFKLAVRRNPDRQSVGRFRLGLFEPGSHTIGPELTPCPLHHSLLRKLLKEIHIVLNESNLEPYFEGDQSGDLRYVIARTNRDGDQLMITWVVTRPLREEICDLTEKLKKRGLPIHVSAMNINSDQGNSIWGQETVLLTEKKFIEEELMGLSFHLGPTSFFQVNPWQAENIYLRIEQMARKLENRGCAWDLFAGVGPISCVLGSLFKRTASLEENTEATSFAKRNAQLNQLEGKIEVLSGLVEKQLGEFPDEFQSPDLIVANPSRRGIHQHGRDLIVSALKKKPGVEFIYLSCDADSLRRDLIYFKANGIVLVELQGFDMHAQSLQIEWLARLKFGELCS